jgi:invasion protein IalB
MNFLGALRYSTLLSCTAFTSLLLIALPLPANASPVRLDSVALNKQSAIERPQITEEKQFVSWGLSCAVAQDPNGNASKRCNISQIVSADPEGKKVVLGVTVDFLDARDVPTMRFRLTPEARKNAGIGIKIDDKPEMRLAIDQCSAKRCEAVGRLTSTVLKMWRTGKVAQLAFIESGGKQVLVPVSLAGFDPALAELRTR